MCANYTPGRNDLIEDETGLAVAFPILPEVFPGQAAPLIILTKNGEWQCIGSSFGLVPVWAKDENFARYTYNARSETADTKPSFRRAWKYRQIGLVPMTSFYEPRYGANNELQNGEAQSDDPPAAVRWRIHRADRALFFAAALFELRPSASPSAQGLISHTLLTVNADGHPLMQRFHKQDDEKRSIVTFDWTQGVQWMMENRGLTSELKQSLLPLNSDLYTAEPAAVNRLRKRPAKTKTPKFRYSIPKKQELF